jgi:hypothetical protein
MFETIVLSVEKSPRTDNHFNYPILHSTCKSSVYREIKQHSVNNSVKRFLAETYEF